MYLKLKKFRKKKRSVVYPNYETFQFEIDDAIATGETINKLSDLAADVQWVDLKECNTIFPQVVIGLNLRGEVGTSEEKEFLKVNRVLFNFLI